jgi:hypothetical protein
MDEACAQEIRSVAYLLAELEGWEAEEVVSREQAARLRGSYERRLEDLRARLASAAEAATTRPPAPEPGAAAAAQPQAPAPRPDAEQAHATAEDSPARQPAGDASPFPFPFPRRAARTSQAARPALSPPAPRRNVVETLTDPQTIRFLLYTGAAMFVVGIVIWLRDVLYQKLQEPLVQAALLMLGTTGVTVAGWLTILRTRLRLTGRALTLIGSLLVPVNFWFLVRSGLIQNNGRAWLVYAFCALLYALTAALLREKLYVYLASVASIIAAWAIIYRDAPEAFGLYALALAGISLVLLHVSRLLPRDDTHATSPAAPPSGEDDGARERDGRQPGRFDYQLWGGPLVQVSLAGSTLAALLYMTLRAGSQPSLSEGIFRLGSSVYDAGVAMLLFACLAYVAWLAGRYIDTKRRVGLYTLSALALVWTEFLAADGLAVSGSTMVLALGLAALALSLCARLARGAALPAALHRAGLIVGLVLVPASAWLVLDAEVYSLAQAAALASLAAAYAFLGTPRFSGKVIFVTLAHASALYASAAFLVALLGFRLESVTLFSAASAAWPFVLYAIAFLVLRLRREEQLAAPFIRIADMEFVLLLLSAGITALLLHLWPEGGILRTQTLRGSMFFVLFAAIAYGALRGRRERSALGVALVSTAALVMVAAAGDALKFSGALPAAWPVAVFVICAAFLISKAAARLLPAPGATFEAGKASATASQGQLFLAGIARFVADSAVTVCATLWLATALSQLESGGAGALFVLLLALLYWSERTARVRESWLVYISAVHAGALCVAVLTALGVSLEWFAATAALTLFPLLFALGRYALARGAEWLRMPAGRAAAAAGTLASLAALLQASTHLRAGDPALLAASVALGAVALVSFGASFWSREHARLQYFRAGLSAAVMAFALSCLRAGFDPVEDVELYTSPVAILVLIVAYTAVRREWNEYARDAALLFWTGSILLAGPLLIRALQFRLLLDLPAPSRDLTTLCASLALVLSGVMGRLRAPLLIGGAALGLELLALALTSVDWMQVPLKVYLISVGALLVIFWGMLEFRREQILLMRKRLSERREYARERFGEWR